MPSSLENYGAFTDPVSHADDYQAKADKLGRVDGTVNNALKSKGVFVVGLVGIVVTIAAVGYMPKIMPSSELADLRAVSGSCAHQVGCATHNDYCSPDDSTKLSCAEPMEGYDFLGDMARQCTEQSGCEVSSTKCSDKVPGSLECNTELDGFYIFEGVVSRCPDVANAAPIVQCMPPTYTTDRGRQILVPPVQLYECLPAYKKTFPTCTACTSQRACARDFPPLMCSTEPGFADKLCCQTAKAGSYVDGGCLTKTCEPVPNCAVGVTCTSGDDSVCLN